VSIPSRAEAHEDTSSAGPVVQLAFGVADDGTVVEVRYPRLVAHVIADRWPPVGLARQQAAPGDPALVLDVSLDWITGAVNVIVDGDAAPGGWERFESDLALFTAERLAGLVAVHAGVIAWNGQVILVPGASGAGKSQLCVAAHARGALVLSDEYALIEPSTGQVRGWQRPVRVRQAGGVRRLDLASPSAPLPVGLVALVQYRHGSGNDWFAVPAAEAVVGLMANTVCARSRPDESLDAALAVANNSAAVSGTRGDAVEALSALIDLLGE